MNHECDNCKRPLSVCGHLRKLDGGHRVCKSCFKQDRMKVSILRLSSIKGSRLSRWRPTTKNRQSKRVQFAVSSSYKSFRLVPGAKRDTYIIELSPIESCLHET